MLLMRRSQMRLRICDKKITCSFFCEVARGCSQSQCRNRYWCSLSYALISYRDVIVYVFHVLRWKESGQVEFESLVDRCRDENITERYAPNADADVRQAACSALA